MADNQRLNELEQVEEPFLRQLENLKSMIFPGNVRFDSLFSQNMEIVR